MTEHPTAQNQKRVRPTLAPTPDRIHWSTAPAKRMSHVEFQGVSKSYPIYDSPGDRLKELITPRRYQFHRDFWALRDISFEIRPGETFCIVGENGSGKSTLLQMVAGILQPTSGTVTVTGRMSALLELGSGFNPEFSGRDNVYLNGSILGLRPGRSSSGCRSEAYSYVLSPEFAPGEPMQFGVER